MNRDGLISAFQDWNTKINLSSFNDYDSILNKHILDSIEINKYINLNNNYDICDVGTGGGFPLLPVAMTNPNSKFIGIESISKKVSVVNSMIQTLHIINANVVCSRSENYKIQKFDFIMARAVTYIDKLLPLTIDLLNKNGSYLLYKMYTKEEDEMLKKIIKRYGLKLAGVYQYKQSNSDIEKLIYHLTKI